MKLTASPSHAVPVSLGVDQKDFVLDGLAHGDAVHPGCQAFCCNEGDVGTVFASVTETQCVVHSIILKTPTMREGCSGCGSSSSLALVASGVCNVMRDEKQYPLPVEPISISF